MLTPSFSWEACVRLRISTLPWTSIARLFMLHVLWLRGLVQRAAACSSTFRTPAVILVYAGQTAHAHGSAVCLPWFARRRWNGPTLQSERSTASEVIAIRKRSPRLFALNSSKVDQRWKLAYVPTAHARRLRQLPCPRSRVRRRRLVLIL